jgi:hypothetical protein
MSPAEEYILDQLEPFKTILLHLQVCIETTVPEVMLIYKYKVPYYYIKEKPFCYLNVTRGYVDIGFSKANQINTHLDYLIADGRKVIKSLRYRKLEDINDQVLIDVLKNAKRLYV